MKDIKRERDRERETETGERERFLLGLKSLNSPRDSRHGRQPIHR